MKIVHVIPGLTYERGGPSMVVEALARHQTAAGNDVVILTTEQGIGLGERPIRAPAGVQLIRHAIVGPDRLAYSPRFAISLAHAIDDSDILHVHSIFTSPIHLTLLAALRERIPVVLRPCGQLHRYSLRKNPVVKRIYLSTCGSMIRRACTTWHYTSNEEATGSWPRDSSPRFILPNGIEPKDFDIAADEIAVRLDAMAPRLDGAPFVVFLGRLHNKKRIDLLVESFLNGAPREFHLIVAGPDEQGLWHGIERQFRKRPENSIRVHRVGLVMGPNKAALLKGASLFALPSEHENFGIAALESLMAGTPTLLSPHVDLNATISSAGLGISAPLDVASWSRSFATVLNDQSMLDRISQRAPAWVANQFSWRKVATDLHGEYERTIERFRYPRGRQPSPDSSSVGSTY